MTKLKAPTSSAFSISWQVEPGDKLDLAANAIEAAALFLRLKHGVLNALHTLAGVTAWIPPLATKPLGEMSSVELELLVERLRSEANRARAMSAIETEKLQPFQPAR